MFQDYYAERAPEQIAKEFGPDFAKAVFGLSPEHGKGRSSPAMAGISSSSTQSSRAGFLRLRKSSPTSNPPGLIKSSARSNGSRLKRCVRATPFVMPPIESVDLGSLRDPAGANVSTEVFPQ